jgi:ParB family transcriptional regulator, chromosome partitioning protein
LLDIKLIKIDQIFPNNYNPNVVSEDILAKLRAEISQKGLCEPIIVRSRDSGYEIVDGEHRWRICRDLGWQEIPCIIQDYDSNEAKIKTLQLNYMRGSAVPVKLASLIHELSKEIKLEDLAKRLPYEEPQMLNNLELLKLPEDFGKTVEEQARKEADELPSVISFVLYKNQLEVAEKAIKIAMEKLPQGAKNQKAMALEYICAEFIDRQGVKHESA